MRMVMMMLMVILVICDDDDDDEEEEEGGAGGGGGRGRARTPQLTSTGVDRTHHASISFKKTANGIRHTPSPPQPPSRTNQ